ncbi:MAG: TolC family protein [Synergistaceae bacterium]|jgi:outer membrane protein TolC|nr:TolC family protein [Synergistaceae bacterium]
MRRKTLFFIVPVILIMMFAPAESAEPVSLDDFLGIVLSNNSALASEAKSAEAAYYSALGALGGPRPSFGVSAGASFLTAQEQEGLRESGESAADLRLTFVQPIDISGKFGLEERQEILAYEMKRAEFARSVNELLASAEESYWSAVFAGENALLQRELLKGRVENLRIAEEKFRLGLVPRLDVVRAEALVVASRTNLAEADAETSNIMAAMALMAGVGVEPAAALESPMTSPDFNAPDSDAALEERPDVKCAALAVRVSDVAVKLAAKGMAPALEVSASWVLFSDPSASSSPQSGELEAVVRLSLPILDNGAKFEKLKTETLKQAAEVSLKHAIETAKMELAVSENNWNRAVALERGRGIEVEKSNEELRITELMYREGMGAQLDLINAQIENQRVRTDYLGAVKEKRVAIVQMRRAVGGYAKRTMFGDFFVPLAAERHAPF